MGYHLVCPSWVLKIHKFHKKILAIAGIAQREDLALGYPLEMRVSMGWLKGKSTGNHRFSHEIWEFPVIYPLNQSIVDFNWKNTNLFIVYLPAMMKPEACPVQKNRAQWRKRSSSSSSFLCSSCLRLASSLPWQMMGSWFLGENIWTHHRQTII